ncbi:MAG: hypothetical protein M1838_004319 [Thelocarpon superellum]|nr:MAG: hypothetical protein M1838_004319 [Thelocarpon superellum]
MQDEDPAISSDPIAEAAATETEGAPLDVPERLQRSKERSSYGSAARRSVRNKRPKELPPIAIPDEFVERNVRMYEELLAADEILAIDGPAVSEPTKAAASDSQRAEIEGLSHTLEVPPPLPTRSSRYHIHHTIWEEILATIRAALSLPNQPYAESFPAEKSHVLLQCPKDGSIYFLDAIVEKVASATGADYLRLDAQDIAEIAGNYMAEKPELTPYTIRALGYDAQQVVARQDSRETEEALEDEEDLEEDDEEDPPPINRSNRASFWKPVLSKISAIPIGTFTGNMDDLIKSGKWAVGNDGPAGSRSGFPPPPARLGASMADHGEGAKLAGVAAALVEARQMKRQGREAASGLTDAVEALAEGEAPRPLIVMIRDYKEIQATTHGGLILQALHDHARDLRRARSRIVVVGTVSSADLMPTLSKSGVRTVQAELEAGPTRTIVVTPSRSLTPNHVFSEDESRRMREINLRHLQDMIRRRTPDASRTADIVSAPILRLDSSQEFASGLEESVWSFDRVHRVAVTALGLMGQEEELSPAMIGAALQMLDASDEVKFGWAAEERVEQRASDEAMAPAPLADAASKETDDKMKRIRKKCNTHEKKLLSGVVNPENIHTTFHDVRAPAETIDALKTLTSLSLLRPEAFSYGVLATDKIPGLLLYGPPGTGKTMLAKAVAKESGATVLEVSGSEVYDMYVGEGEKNVKAIFTLAKKLSPCVVFIDEADAIFGSRSGSSNRTSHRELINQFLREWDGMNDLSAFIMVATNRPFDLDDAVLRRLPRRLLVDLPLEADREAILRIHLRHEVLDPSVILSDLAQRTPFYSGSDLKNLCVAAALACVREEHDLATAHAQDFEPYRFPEKRTLSPRHFDRAMEEISASISEDMSSLAAVRKFDEKYGDRRGRRKKRASYGFGSATEAEKHETGRVRN